LFFLLKILFSGLWSPPPRPNISKTPPPPPPLPPALSLRLKHRIPTHTPHVHVHACVHVHARKRARALAGIFVRVCACARAGVGVHTCAGGGPARALGRYVEADGTVLEEARCSPRVFEACGVPQSTLLRVSPSATPSASPILRWRMRRRRALHTASAEPHARTRTRAHTQARAHVHYICTCQCTPVLALTDPFARKRMPPCPPAHLLGARGHSQPYLHSALHTGRCAEVLIPSHPHAVGTVARSISPG
jgi:hypothetical protein